MTSVSRGRIHPAGIWFALAFTLIIAATEAIRISRGVPEDDTAIVIGVVLTAALGSYLVAKRPSNRLSWILAWTGILAAATALVDGLIPGAPTTLSVAEGAFVAMGNILFLLFVWMVLGMFLLLFPTGKPPSPRWNWLPRAAFGLVLLALPLEALAAEWCQSWGEGPDEVESCVVNPIGVEGIGGSEPLLFALLGLVVVAMIGVVVRYRRSAELERRQLKVFVFAVVLILLTVVLAESVVAVTGEPVPSAVQFVLDLILWTSLPIATGVAILRHGLYEIDRVISRSVSYLLIVLLMGGLFAAIVIGLPDLIGLDSSLAVAGGTLLAFYVFRPLLRVVQRRVDRVFNRQKYNADQILEAFAVSIRDEVDPDRLSEAWTRTVGETLEPSSLGVWLRRP